MKARVKATTKKGVKEMKFNSQICTTREQSERLLALGLKKETADMLIWIDNRATEARNTSYITQDYFLPYYREHLIRDGSLFIPAWSLHRLIEMMPKSIYHKNLCCFLFIASSVYVQYRIDLYGASQTIEEQFMKGNLWDNIINCIEWLIKEGYFNKEYLER